MTSEATIPLSVDLCRPELREPGVVFVTTRPGGLPTAAAAGWVLGIAQDGSIPMERRFEGTSQDIRVRADGRIFFSQSAQGLVYELSPRGDVLSTWHAAGKWAGRTPPPGSVELPVNITHHTVSFTADGNFLLLDVEQRELVGWGDDRVQEDHRARAKVMGDVICEVTLAGDLVRRHHLFDILDPYRVTEGSFDHYWRKQGFPESHDWSHVNAVCHDPHDDTLVVSVRHQNAILKLERESGRILWILGEHRGWREPWAGALLRPVEGLEWQFHQHDASVPSRNRVLCFDNGNYRKDSSGRLIADGANYSRAVEFEVDPEAMSVSQVWSYGEKRAERIYGCYQGGALRLPQTQNTFITFGGVCFADGQPTSRNLGAFGLARLIEVTAQGEVVLDIAIDDSASQSPRAFSAFRAAHRAADSDAG